MAIITKEEVIKIAKLSRLELTEKEIKKMQKDLSGILDYFNLLKKVKSKVKISDLIKKEESLRKDQANPQLDSVVKKLIEAAPDKKENYVKVKAVF